MVSAIIKGRGGHIINLRPARGRAILGVSIDPDSGAFRPHCEKTYRTDNPVVLRREHVCESRGIVHAGSETDWRVNVVVVELLVLSLIFDFEFVGVVSQVIPHTIAPVKQIVIIIGDVVVTVVAIGCPVRPLYNPRSITLWDFTLGVKTASGNRVVVANDEFRAVEVCFGRH